MFRQIAIHPEDQKYQKIIWRDSPNQEISVYQITRVAYGQAAAPYLALRTVQQCAKDYQHEYPRRAAHALEAFYVDDLLTGADTEGDLLDIQHEIEALYGMSATGQMVLKRMRNE